MRFGERVSETVNALDLDGRVVLGHWAHGFLFRMSGPRVPIRFHGCHWVDETRAYDLAAAIHGGATAADLLTRFGRTIAEDVWADAAVIVLRWKMEDGDE